MRQLGENAFSLLAIPFIVLGSAITFAILPVFYASLVVLPTIGTSAWLGIPFWAAFLVWWLQFMVMLLVKVGFETFFWWLVLVSVIGNGWLYLIGAKHVARSLC